jgi:hypothetical protein
MDNRIYLKTHIANWLRKCHNCNYWKGVGNGAEDDEVCEKSVKKCPRFYINPVSDEIFEVKEDKWTN